MQKIKYRIGLDLGIASVGWAVLGNDLDGNPERIIARGVRVFDACENPKDGKSLTEQRREARDLRRRFRRKQHRLFRIKQLIGSECKMSFDEILKIFDAKYKRDIYTVRVEVLDKKINREDWTRLLVHLAQRRGFKSNRKNDNAGDAGKLLKAVKSNEEEISKIGCRTVGEFLYKKYIVGDDIPVRNKAGNYDNTFSRKQIENEVDIIFDKQRKYGNDFASLNFQKKYKDILFSQRPFDEGPGKGSKWGGGIEKMVGMCTFEKGEVRASKNSYSFERFMVLQKVNNLKIIVGGKIQNLNSSQRLKLVDAAFNKNKVTYKDVREILQMKEGNRFSYFTKDEETFIEVKGYHALRKCLNNISKDFIKSMNVAEIDRIAYCLTVFKNEERIRDELTKQGLDKKVIDVLTGEKAPSFSKFSHLSLKAINKILPGLEDGNTYDKSCELAGYDFRNQNKDGIRTNKLSFNEIRNDIIAPVVRRTVSQTIKVLNAIVREYGNPEVVYIELAREMAKNFDERHEISKSNEENRTKNDAIKVRIKKEHGLMDPSGEDIVKYKLWEEQQCHCAYSGEAISAERLFEHGYAEVDHIIPWSKSFDNSYNNKVLVLTKYNQEKGNRLPLEYISTKGENEVNRFKHWVEQCIDIKRYVKKNNLLRTEFDEEGFKQKNLQDTQYATRKLAEYIRNNLQFAVNYEIGTKVVCINGMATAYLRSRWGFNKDRETDDHHAKDAIFIACCNQKLISNISTHERIRKAYVCDDKNKKLIPINKDEMYNNFEDGKHFPLPWKEFRNDIDLWFSRNPQDKSIKPLFVSRMSNHKITGQAHKETYMRTILDDNEQEYFVKKVKLQDLKLKDGEIENYYDKEHNVLLYAALVEQIKKYDGDAKKAFADKFYKPCKSGIGNPVNTVKIKEKTSGNVKLKRIGASAANGDMIRIDVFAKIQSERKQFYFVPIYVADFKKRELPNMACPSGEIMDAANGFVFEFSLYAKDLVKIKRKTDIEPIVAYYVKSNRSTGAIDLISHNRDCYYRSVGIKTLEFFEKWEVDVLGNYRKVPKIPREVKTLYRGK